MPSFEINRKITPKDPQTTTEQVVEVLKDRLSQHFRDHEIKITETGLSVKGDLKGSFQRAITKAETQVNSNDDGEIIVKSSGSVGLGTVLPLLCIALGFVTAGFFWGVFLVLLVDYYLSRDKPKEYFEEAMENTAFEFGE